MIYTGIVICAFWLGVFILQTYCPDKLQQFQDKVNKLKFDDTVKG